MSQGTKCSNTIIQLCFPSPLWVTHLGNPSPIGMQTRFPFTFIAHQITPDRCDPDLDLWIHGSQIDHKWKNHKTAPFEAPFVIWMSYPQGSIIYFTFSIIHFTFSTFLFTLARLSFTFSRFCFTLPIFSFTLTQLSFTYCVFNPSKSTSCCHLNKYKQDQ